MVRALAPPPRGRRGSGIASSRPSLLARIDRVLAPLTWVLAALVVLLLFVGPSLVGADKPAPAPAAAANPGSVVFTDAGCGSCHTFKPAGATGSVGPDLDDTKLDAAGIAAVVTSGRGSMPRFGGQLSSADIKAVAAYVASGGAKTPAPSATPAPAAGAPEVAATIRAADGPDGITVAGDGTVWLAGASAGTLTRIPSGADAFAGRGVDVGREPDSPVVAGGAVWLVASGDGAAVRVQGTRVTKIPTGREPSGLAVDGRTVWVANGGEGTVTRIDRATAKVRGGPIDVGGQPADVAVARGVVWVTDFDGGTVTRIDAATGRVTGDPIRVGRRPRGIAIGGGSVWVANAGDGTVTRIDAAAGTVTGSPIRVGANPREIAVGAGAVWVANAADDTVTRIDRATGEVAGDPIPVGKDPIGVAAGQDAVYTADFRGNTVTKIRP